MSNYKKESKKESKNPGKAGPSAVVIKEAQDIAKGTQRPGQSKEQTKLIAQGIQKGIEQYKKKQKGKARELDKKLKKVSRQASAETPEVEVEVIATPPAVGGKALPWILLALSWLGFAAYVVFLPDP